MTGACAVAARPPARDAPGDRPETGARPGRRCAGCPRASPGPGRPASASASRIARTWFVGRQYQSIAARGATSVEDSGPSRRIRSSNSITSASCSRNVLVRRASRVPIPGHAVPGELGRRDEREALVVGLVQPAVLVQERIGPLPPIAVDARGQDQVVVAAGHVDRVELDGPEPLEDGLDRRRLGRQGSRRREQMAANEESARGRTVDRLGGGHEAMVA